MELNFPWHELTKAFEEIDSAKTARTLYDRETGKGIWLVGDSGVYLLPNTTDGVHHKTAGERVVIYADECNPLKLDFDTWWDNKRRSFGGDDGCEFLDAADIRRLALHPPSPRHKPESLVITFASDQLSLHIKWSAAH